MLMVVAAEQRVSEIKLGQVFLSRRSTNDHEQHGTLCIQKDCSFWKKLGQAVASTGLIRILVGAFRMMPGN